LLQFGLILRVEDPLPLRVAPTTCSQQNLRQEFLHFLPVWLTPLWVEGCWHQLVASGPQVKICGLEVPAFPANAFFKYLPTEVSLLVPPFRLLLLFQGHWNLTQHGGTYSTYNLAVQSNCDPALVLVSTVTLPDLSSTFQRAFLHYTFRAF
jgi:hypothetical protein